MRHRDRSDALRLRARWGARRRVDLTAAGTPANVVAWVAAVAIAVAVGVWWFQ